MLETKIINPFSSKLFKILFFAIAIAACFATWTDPSKLIFKVYSKRFISKLDLDVRVIPSYDTPAPARATWIVPKLATVFEIASRTSDSFVTSQIKARHLSFSSLVN